MPRIIEHASLAESVAVDPLSHELPGPVQVPLVLGSRPRSYQIQEKLVIMQVETPKMTYVGPVDESPVDWIRQQPFAVQKAESRIEQPCGVCGCGSQPTVFELSI